MAEYIDIEQARTTPGLRIVLPPGRPNPWGEALKGICRVKKIPFVRVRKAQGHDAALVAWTCQSSAPVAVWNDERPRSTWIEQLYLAERLAPQPALIPEIAEDRILMFGLSNELCGENGLGWAKRLMLLHPAIADTQSQASAHANYMGAKYGYSRAAVEAAPGRVAQILQLLDARLARQQAGGREFFIGERLSALDIYWAAFAGLIAPLPPEMCQLPEALRSYFTNTDPTVAAAATPRLMEHRIYIYQRYLEVPVDL